MLLLLICSFISNIGNLLGPSFSGKAINAASAGKGNVDMALVKHYALLMLIAYVDSNIVNFFVNFGMTRVSRRVAENMRRDVFNKLMVLPVGYFDRNQAGDIMSRVSYDIDVVCTSLSTGLVSILTSVVTVVGSFLMMCTVSIPLVACMLFTLPMALFFTCYMSRKTRPLYAKRSAAYGKMNGYTEEMFTGQKTILAYAREDDVCQQFSAINRGAAEAYRNADGLGMITGPTIGLINNIGLSAIGLGGALLYLKNVVNLGQISSFVLYCRKFNGPINEIANIINEIFSALAASERVFQLLDQPEEAKDIYGAVELQDCRRQVEAENVSFGYVPGKTILHSLNLKAQPGQTVAIVGPTGAGKTTIINLLMRFYDPDSGCIRVDGRENQAYTMASLRRNYAMVLQDTWLFQGTIYENIAYGKEGATREEVIAAAKAACIHNYIMRLPDGYDTVIHEDGGNISKGQKQLLTIARGHALQYGHADPGRGHQQCGYQHGAAGTEGHAQPDAGQNLLHHRPPALHYSECGQDPGGGSRGCRRTGNPRDPDAAEGLLLSALRQPVRITQLTPQFPEELGHSSSHRILRVLSLLCKVTGTIS